MEPNTQQQDSKQISPARTVSERPTRMTKKTKWLITGGVVLLLVIAVIVWRVYVKHRALTPEETLQQLEQTSQPVTATPMERKAELEDLKKQSAPIKTTNQESLNMLQQLRQ